LAGAGDCLTATDNQTLELGCPPLPLAWPPSFIPEGARFEHTDSCERARPADDFPDEHGITQLQLL